MKGHRAAQLMFGAGLAGWVVAAVFDAARTGRTEALAGGELLQMASAGLLLLGVYTFARAGPWRRPGTAELARLDPRDRARRGQQGEHASLLIGLAFLAVVFGILGAIVYPGGGTYAHSTSTRNRLSPPRSRACCCWPPAGSHC